ncbi:hypothetical protein HKX48_009200 [Thoreauomyces humboldtii]|nr:hypothetical protein HKX48_009200 [Thoreauomyces humboldtii]
MSTIQASREIGNSNGLEAAPESSSLRRRPSAPDLANHAFNHDARSTGSRMQSKHTIRDNPPSDFDKWHRHEYRLVSAAASGILGGVALAIVSHLASGATVASQGWFNAMHIVIGLLCMALGHFGTLVTIFATRAYVASSLLGDDGISLSHVALAVTGSSWSALECLINDRFRLRKDKDHAAVGRRPNGLLFSAIIRAGLAVGTPLLHVLLILGTNFTSTFSPVAQFQCDVPDYSHVLPINVSTWSRGFDYLTAEKPTSSLATVTGTEIYLAGCHDVDGHDELEIFEVYETVQALRLQIECGAPISAGNLTYSGAFPVPAGQTDIEIILESFTCQSDFCILNTQLNTFGTNASTTNCVASTQGVKMSGIANFLRKGFSRVCQNFAAETNTVAASDPSYMALFAASLQSVMTVTARWPRDAWMGGLAFELSMDPPFVGIVTAAESEHIVTRFVGGFHRMIAGTYNSPTQIACPGSGDLGAGVISIPLISRALGIAFGAMSVAIAVYMITSERDIQLIVSARNYRRAISALCDPLRFATMLDRTDATRNFSEMCDTTPETLAVAGSTFLVAMGGDCEVVGSTGHACITTVESIDSFSATKTYKGRCENPEVHTVL